MEEITKFTTARCVCGLTWDSRRSRASNYDHALQTMRRHIRRHIYNPELDECDPKKPHIVTETTVRNVVFSQ